MTGTGQAAVLPRDEAWEGGELGPLRLFSLRLAPSCWAGEEYGEE